MTTTTELALHKPVTIENVRERIAYLEDLNSRGVGTAVAHQQWELACLRELALSLDALAAKDKQIADSENRIRQQNRHVCELFDDNTSLRQRIAELEAKLQAADTLQDGAFRHGLQHGFSYGQTNNQAGFEQCIAAYSSQRK